MATFIPKTIVIFFLYLATVLVIAAAATNPDQVLLFTTVKLLVYGFFHQENASTLVSADQAYNQSTTISQPDNDYQTFVVPQNPHTQPDEILEKNEKPLNQSTQQAHTQPETVAVDDVHTIQAAGVNSSHETLQANSSYTVQESRLQAKQTEPLKEEVVKPSQTFQIDNSQYGTSSLKGSPETISVRSLEPLNLSSGASFMLGAISTTFSCLDRPYGYYADPDNNCHIFHVCNSSFFPDGSVHTYQYRSVLSNLVL